MSETTLNAYITQLTFFKNMCLNVNTTLSDLALELDNLNTLDLQIDSECENMTTPPSTFSHFQKYVAVEVQRSRKADIHASMVKLVNLRIENENDYCVANPDTAIEYIDNTNQMKEFIKSVVGSCDCMSERALIISSF